MNEWMNESMNEWMNESINQSINQSVDEWLHLWITTNTSVFLPCNDLQTFNEIMLPNTLEI